MKVKEEKAVKESIRAIDFLKSQIAYRRADKNLSDFEKQHLKEINLLERTRDRGYGNVRERAIIRLEEIQAQHYELITRVQFCAKHLHEAKRNYDGAHGKN